MQARQECAQMEPRGVLQRRQGGFTIIELMVAVTIIGLVLMFGLPGMASWLQSTQIRTAAESIQGGLQAAKAEAVRRNQAVQFVFTSLVADGTASWEVSCVTPAADCPGAGMTQTEIQKYSAKEGAPSAQVAATQAAIVFNGVGRVPAAPVGGITINVTNPNGGACAADAGPMRCLRIQVTSGGQVKMCDPALPTSNPRGC